MKEPYSPEAEKLFEKMKKAGYDGISRSDKNILIVFNPNQIKAVSNKGTFDGNNPNIYYSNPHIGAGILGGSYAGLETDENGEINGFNPQKFALGFASGAGLSKGLQLSAKRLEKLASTNKRAKRLLDKVEFKNDKIALKNKDKTLLNVDFRIFKTLRKYKVDNLKMLNQNEYSNFIDTILTHKDFKNAPNIVKIATLNYDLQKALGLNNGEVFLIKNNLSHFRPERKRSFNQDLGIDTIKTFPTIIKNAQEAYIDRINQNFFITHKLNDENLAFLHFNIDEMGNFIITAKQASKSDLHKKQYKKIEIKSAMDRNRT